MCSAEREDDMIDHRIYAMLRYFQVPLNYSEPGGETASIAIARLPSALANSPAYRRPILIYPGGLSQIILLFKWHRKFTLNYRSDAGGSGIEKIRKGGLLLSQVVGPQFDIVGFDPRGQTLFDTATPQSSSFIQVSVGPPRVYRYMNHP